mgnify:CR=1 FL=1
MPSSSITSVDIESGLNSGDALLTTVTVGGAVVGGAIVGMEKVAPKSIKNKMKRQKSYLKKKTEEIKQNNPCCFRVINTILAIINLGLYFFDIISDVNLLFIFWKNNHMDWFYLTLGFLCLNHFIAIVGIVVYLRKEKDWSIIALFCASPFIIIAPLLFDVCMPFYRLLQNRLPDSFVTFMVQYEATRTLSESFLESLPQTCLQVYIYMQCLDNTCAGIEKEGQSALVFSLAINSYTTI